MSVNFCATRGHRKTANSRFLECLMKQPIEKLDEEILRRDFPIADLVEGWFFRCREKCRLGSIRLRAGIYGAGESEQMGPTMNSCFGTVRKAQERSTISSMLNLASKAEPRMLLRSSKHLSRRGVQQRGFYALALPARKAENEFSRMFLPRLTRISPLAEERCPSRLPREECDNRRQTCPASKRPAPGRAYNWFIRLKRTWFDGCQGF